MTEIEQLIDALRRGQAEDPAEHIRLLVAALRDGNVGPGVLLSLLDSARAGLRLAGKRRVGATGYGCRPRAPTRRP